MNNSIFYHCYQLCQSLNSAEKRTIQLSFGNKKTNKALLFNILSTSEIYNEPILIQQFSSDLRNNYKIVVYRLYKHLLKNLQKTAEKNHLEINIRNQINQAKILLARELYDAAIHLLNKVIKVCKKISADLLLLDALQMFRTAQVSKDMNWGNMLDIITQEIHLVENIHENKNLLQMQIEIIQSYTANSSNLELIAKILPIAQRYLQTNSTNTQAKVYANNILVNVYLHKQQYEQAVAAIRLTLNYYTNEEHINFYQNDYNKTLITYSSILFLQQLYPELEQSLILIYKQSLTSTIQQYELKAYFLIFYLGMKFHGFDISNKTQLIANALIGLIEYEKIGNERAKIRLISCLTFEHWINNDLDNSLKLLAYLNNEDRNNNFSPHTKITWLTLEALIHIELGNYMLTNKYWRKICYILQKWQLGKEPYKDILYLLSNISQYPPENKKKLAIQLSKILQKKPNLWVYKLENLIKIEIWLLRICSSPNRDIQ